MLQNKTSSKNLWNIKNLDRPSISTYKTKRRDVDLKGLRAVLKNAIQTFSNQDKLDNEAALLSRCIYRTKLKLRREKGLKAMEKTNHALLIYLKMNITQDLRTFYQMVPECYSSDTYLPTRNMLQYILVRLQGLSKLLIRIADTAKDSAFFMNQRIGIGQFWKVAFICFGVASRIFYLIKDLTNKCCQIYSQLRKFVDVLQNTGQEWLPLDYNLVQDLKLWLNVDYLDIKETATFKPKSSIPLIFTLIDSDNEADDYGKVESTEFQQCEMSSITIDEGIGEVVERCVPKTKKKRNKRNLTKSSQSVKSIQTFQDLKLFQRNFSNYNFKNLDKMQQNMLHALIKKHIKKCKKSISDKVKLELCLANAKNDILLNLK